MRFQKRIKIAPGVRINISKSGVSTSLGGRGATVNLSSKGVRTTVGIPGSGMSWSKQEGWSGAAGLKPADELKQHTKLLENIANSFNKLSPRVNKVSTRWNKAIESFDGGRGPSTAKFSTLNKRYGSAMADYQKIEDDVADQQAALIAISGRLNAMKFGVFSGKLKATQKDLVELSREYGSGVRQLVGALRSIREDVGNELAKAERSI